MGNSGSSSMNGRRRATSRRQEHTATSQPEITANRYVFAAATPHPPPQYSGPPPPPPPPHHQPYYPYPVYYPAPPLPLPAPYDHHHRVDPNWVNGRYPCGLTAPFVEHQKAVTIRNDVNLKKESLRIVPDVDNPGKFLIAFTFDATVSGSITITFFAKEGEGCCLSPTKETLLPPVTVQFQNGLAQKFKQPPGTGLELSMFEEGELSKEGETGVYPLAIKAEASPDQKDESGNENPKSGSTNSQITQAVFDKDKGEEYQVKVLKQILWVNGMRYELQEIYGIGNSVDENFDENNDTGKECVICLSEPPETTVLPCRHMCMCSSCAKVLRFQTNRCPICRQPVERLLEIKVSSETEE